MSTGKCLLCGANDAKLVRAHIIPKSLYGDALAQDSGPTQLMSITKGRNPKRTQIGIYDSSIICEECERRFAPWDDYAHELFFETKSTRILEKNGVVIGYQFDNVDYSKLKLFFISLLWRAHASKHDFFKHVDLGSFAARARQMILDRDPGDFQEFGIHVIRFDSYLAEAFLNPSRNRLFENINIYNFYFARHHAIIKVDNRKYSKPFQGLMLKPNSAWYVPLRKHETSKEFQLALKAFENYKTYSRA